uniref:Prokaryotic-type class I peptide chain release factors domain-containing protein n=1 Tax=Chromera velia CCMP2878 TaxID=1169474 RepID=A0A0G4HP82_9ALVE|eukprot:Cvel_1214.t1-p1 / transcript=Cvel_1214.t1 / gene=Cvel_1214 / organism=Chromera_velia_CCMP2878 / gene_product=Probable peptide chain release factor C12orf65, putative / transcript_product=Probable peptide chain release factor C12orf65, putative / location=Cvel_scaffold40:113458-113994(-) / protein_length=179 / sequence_SO=supercontig / SO=protein_coding / is_pseudo=false
MWLGHTQRRVLIRYRSSRGLWAKETDRDVQPSDSDEVEEIAVPLDLDLNDLRESSLEEQLRHLGIKDKDLEEKFVRGSGAGGQKINKTASCVMLIHKPTGMTVRCQDGRSQKANRLRAREILVGRLAGQVERAQFERRQQRAKEDRKGRPPPEKEKRKRRDDKKRRSDVKKFRSGKMDF